MKFRAEARVPLAPAVVFAAYRDRMSKILEFLPNVRAIDLNGREEEGPAARLLSTWYGGGEVSAAVRGIIEQKMLGWSHQAIWRADALGCDWRSQGVSFPSGGVELRGRTSFVDDGDGETRISIEGVIEVDARKLPGVPGFLAKRVGANVEEFLGEKIRVNLVESTKWFQAHRAELESARVA
jgi:hypothetical protein